MTKSNIKCLSSNELERIEIKIKIPKELNEFVDRFATFLRIPREELLNDVIKQGIQGIIGTFDGYGLNDIVQVYGLTKTLHR